MAKVAIVGAGPAGATLALLLAERGIDVTLLERRADFAREFRGEVLMPGGVDALAQMGLAGLLDRIPNRLQREFALYLNGRLSVSGSLDAGAPVAVSQPALLEGVVELAQRHAGMEFHPGASVRSLLRDRDRIVGVTFGDAAGERQLHADLVVGADGRNSFVRRQLAVTTRSTSPPMDVVWCKVPRPQWWRGARGYVGRGHLLIAYHTWDDSLQVAWAILKGTFGDLRGRGIAAWVEEMANFVSDDLADHLRGNTDRLSRPFLLESVSGRVVRWSRPGALLIGDAAHAMSPVGGQGLNIALRDAIVAANHLVPALSRTVDPGRLARALADVEAERLREVAPIQRLQAVPPKLVLSQAWFGELARRAAGRAVQRPFVQRLAARRASDFLHGLTEVRLNV